MAEGLGRLIKHFVLSHDLRGFSVHGSPAITHQQFVDDNMLFGHTSVNEARTFKALLDTFSEASGTTINMTKSQFFSSILLFPLKESLLKSLDSLKPRFLFSTLEPLS